jgi:hypothetical protein
MSDSIIAQTAPAGNMVPVVWGEYQLRQNPTLYSAVWNCSDGAILGTLGFDRLVGYYFDPAMTADGEYVPAFEGWEAYITADVDSLTALAQQEGRAA